MLKTILIPLLILLTPFSDEPNIDVDTSTSISLNVSKMATEFNLNYAPYFDCDYPAIYAKMNDLLPIIQREANLYGVDPKLALAIVGPEMFRYSSFKDFFETTALETLYVNYGSSTTDFSIGQFQMKPSFIEELEVLHPNLKGYSSADPILIRKQRIQRLKSEKWQIRYAIAYCLLMEKHKGAQQIKNTQQRIKYIATAYNLGLKASDQTIKKWSNKKVFPYGEKFGKNQCSYGDIATLIYKHINTN